MAGYREKQLIYIEEHHLCFADGTALGKDHNAFVTLQGVDNRQHDDHLQHRAKHGQGNVPELLGFVGPVQSGAFVHILGDVLQACDKEQHIVAHRTPDRHQNGGEHGQIGAQPIHAPVYDVPFHQVLIQDAVIRVENIEEHNGDNRRADDCWHKIHGPQEVTPSEAPVQQNRQHQRQGQGDDQLAACIHEGVHDGVPELAVLEQLPEIVQPDEALLAVALVIIEHVAHGPCDGIDAQGRSKEQTG
ncbi:hypothetical protein D3C75_773400 [compost metagenome]